MDETYRKQLEYLFLLQKAHRIYAELDERNVDSKRLLERCNFRQEGYFKQDCFSKGEWTDTYVYAILEDDWLKMKG